MMRTQRTKSTMGHGLMCGFIGVAGLALPALAQAPPKVEVKRVFIERPPGTVAIVTVDPVASDFIELFRDANFEDESEMMQITSGHPAGGLRELPNGLEDSLSSLRWSLPPGVLVLLYEDDGGKGEQLALWGSGQIANLDEFDFENKASQWAWYYVGGAAEASEAVRRGAAIPVGANAWTTPGPPDSMTLHKSKNFEANTVTIDHVTAHAANQLHRLPEDLPDSLTSLRWNLPPGVVAMLYQDADGGKQQVAIWSSGQIADLDIYDFNDKASRWAWYYIGSPDTEVVGYTAPPARGTVEKDTVVAADADSIDLVAAAMKSNELKVEANDLRAKKNPAGAGTFVYVPETQFNGVERKVIWIVVDGKPYAITGAAKMITPSLATEANATEVTWSSTGLNRMHAEEDAAKIVYAD